MERAALDRARIFRKRPRAAFTMIEMIITIGILAVLASILIPAMSAHGTQSLQSAARILAADLRLARSLAVQTGSEWSVQFDLAQNSYEVLHTGSGTPPTLRNALAAAGQEDGPYEVCFDKLAGSGDVTQRIVIMGAATKESRGAVTDIEFTAQGGTGPLRSEDTVIWVCDHVATGGHYVRLTISWITGQVWIDTPQVYDADELDPLYE